MNEKNKHQRSPEEQPDAMHEENQSQQPADEQNNPTEKEQEQQQSTSQEAETSTTKEAELEKLRNDYQELKDKYLRLYAEFENYKKRTIREKMETMKTASQDTMSALLPILDDFDRAKKLGEDESSPETFPEGLKLLYNKLYSTLEQKGLQPMNPTGERFDPELHEAFTEVPAPSEDMKGCVVDTIEKGYKLNDKIIRHAKVVVGK